MNNCKNINEQQYISLLCEIMENGVSRDDRTGVGTISLFGLQRVYDIQKGFPLLTTKKMHWKGIVGELLWFLRGETNVKSLQNDGIRIWNEWADENGDLGPLYGWQWRNFPRIDWDDGDPSLAGSVDQIEEVRKSILSNPNSRRHIVAAWNPGMIHEMALPPCHAFFQFYVRGEYLDCQLYQRSSDSFLGNPYNIASYSLLMHIMALKTDLKPGRFIHTLGDAHIYLNHLDQVNEQIHARFMHPAPKLIVDPDVKGLPWEELRIEHFKLTDYISEPKLEAPIAV